jgi:hypothetical protein
MGRCDIRAFDGDLITQSFRDGRCTNFVGPSVHSVRVRVRRR